MAIYNISDFCEKEMPQKILSSQQSEPSGENSEENPSPKKDRFFSSLAARLFFLLLLFVDILWGVYSLCKFALSLILCMPTMGKVAFLNNFLSKSYLSCKRALVCAVALMVAVFSPALGIMFSCMYFLMYDRAGVEEIVPSSLQDQFQEFFQA